MEDKRLAFRVLNEIAAARAAISASYLRLWRSPGPSTIDPGDPGRDALGPNPEGEATGDEESSRDAG